MDKDTTQLGYCDDFRSATPCRSDSPYPRYASSSTATARTNGNRLVTPFTLRRVLKTENVKLKTAKGFTLLFASLVSSLLLAVGLAIFEITLKEIILSSTARDSAYAIYTADTGIECAFYWDFKYNGNSSAFATSSFSSPAATISCNNQTITPSIAPVTPNSAVTTFTLTMSPQPYCATVVISKSGNPVNTVVTSHGYNTCVPGDPRRIERALQANY